MKRKMFAVLAATMAMVASTTMISFAGQWKKDHIGWWWQEDNGSYPVNTWQWIDGNNDKTAECYYFNESGYCLMNTTTPDGYQVDANGAWIVNGKIQTKTVSTAPSANTAISDAELMRYRSARPIDGEHGVEDIASLWEHLWNYHINCNNYLKIGNYIYFAGAVNSGAYYNDISTRDYSLYRVSAHGTQYGTPEILYNWGKQSGQGLQLWSMGQGKLNLSLITNSDTRYYQYDLLNGSMIESSQEGINATKIEGNYHANDQMYYQVTANSTFSTNYKVTVRNYKGETVRTMTIDTSKVLPMAKNSYLSTRIELENGIYSRGAYLDGDTILIRDIRIENCNSAPQKSSGIKTSGSTITFNEYILPEGAVRVMYELRFDRQTGKFLGYDKFS